MDLLSNLWMLAAAMVAYWVKSFSCALSITLQYCILVGLATKFPDKLSLGMEIRDKLVNYVGEKIAALRVEHPGQVKAVQWTTSDVFFFCSKVRKYFRYQNQCNETHYQLFPQGPSKSIFPLQFDIQTELLKLLKLFFCFADPHFKKANHRRRIIK